MTYTRKKTCFVIMPYGKRSVEDGKEIDFDRVYEKIIKPAVTGDPLSMECVRSDFSRTPGSIHAQMFRSIFEADVAVVELTTLNPNVLYELGARHAAKKSVTVMMGRTGIRMPFNIAGHRILEYEPLDKAMYKSDSRVRKELQEFIAAGLANLGKTDSPIYDDLRSLKVTLGDERKMGDPTLYSYPIKKLDGKTIGIVAGPLLEAWGVADVWVNPENLHMQMARPYDRSISATIRYAGATKTIGGNIKDDVIADALREAMKKDHERSVVQAHVISTDPGELERTHAVKKIFHVAAARGTLGEGYEPVKNIGDCVTNVLMKADSAEFEQEGLKSILIPLIGTGTSRGALDEGVPKLIGRALDYFRRGKTRIESVYFLAWSLAEFEICQGVIESAPEIDATTAKGEPIKRQGIGPSVARPISGPEEVSREKQRRNHPAVRESA